MSQIKEKTDKRGILKTAWRTIVLNFKLRWQYSKSGAILFVLLLPTPGLFSALSAPTLESFLKGVELTAQGAGMAAMFSGALVLCGVRVLRSICGNVHAYMDERQEMRVRCDLSAMAMRAFSRKEPAAYEDPAMLNHIEKAKKGIDGFTDFFSLVVGEAVFAAAYLAGMIVYLGGRSPLLLSVMLLSLLPIMASSAFVLKFSRQHEELMAPVSRASDYCEKAIVGRESFKETRLLGAFNFFHGKYSAHISEQAELKKKLLIREKLIDAAGNMIALIGFSVMLAASVHELLAGRIETAAFAAIFANLLSIFQELALCAMNIVSRSMIYLPPLENLYAAMDMPERKGMTEEADGLDGVSLSNVHFRYPGAEQEAVRGVTLEIEPRETIAVVGENGAGKTTLVRLLAGLYLPTEGTVMIGGKDTRSMDLSSAVRNTSAVFQKFMRYKLNLAENVRISETEEQTDVAAPLEQAGLPVDSPCFPEGEKTMLSREFDGVDLSGGQWQRVAIARGLYRSHGMIVLDEPTAAIDPLEETRVYQKFSELSRDQTAVIVTHRMGSARIADRIVVMKDGVIDDVGTHDELMARGGEYARMVSAQAEWYESPELPEA